MSHMSEVGARQRRLLLWTWTEPDAPSGTPAILSQLLSRLDAGSAEVICERRLRPEQRRRVSFPHRIRRWPLPRVLWPLRRGDRVRETLRWLTSPLMVPYGLYRVVAFQPDAILTIHRDGLWLLSAYVLSKVSRRPLTIWVHDTYRDTSELRGGVHGALARWIEPRVLRHARVAVLSESLGELYRREYGVESTVIRHLASEPPRPRRERGTRVVGFAGAIYGNNEDSLRRLAAALKRVGGLEMRVFTNADRAKVLDLGFDEDNTKVRFVRDYGELLDELSACDLLYLPLSAQGSADLPPSSLRCALPTKSIDYLLAGAPIVVHAPADFEVSTFFAQRDAAHVLTDDSEDALADLLQRFRRGALPTLNEETRRATLAEFDAEENLRRLLALIFDSDEDHA